MRCGGAGPVSRTREVPCCCWVALWSKSRELVRVGAEPGGRVGRRSKPAPSLALSSGLCCLGPHRQLHGHSAALQSTVHSRAPALPAPRLAPPPPSARASEPTHLGREAGYRFGRPAQCISVVHLAAPSRQHGPSQAPSLSGISLALRSLLAQPSPNVRTRGCTSPHSTRAKPGRRSRPRPRRPPPRPPPDPAPRRRR